MNRRAFLRAAVAGLLGCTTPRGLLVEDRPRFATGSFVPRELRAHIPWPSDHVVSRAQLARWIAEAERALGARHPLFDEQPTTTVVHYVELPVRALGRRTR